MTATTDSASRFATSSSGKPAKGAPGKAVADGGEAGAAKKPSKLKSRKFVIMMLAVVLVGGGGAYKFMAPKKVSPPAGGDVVSMDPTTLNLSDGHYLKIAISIQLVKGKASTASFFSSHAAELVIDEFSDRSVDSLSSNAARTKLSDDLLAKIKQAYPGEVYDVFVTQFVTQ